jgi:hypothetical protein
MSKPTKETGKKGKGKAKGESPPFMMDTPRMSLRKRKNETQEEYEARKRMRETEEETVKIEGTAGGKHFTSLQLLDMFPYRHTIATTKPRALRTSEGTSGTSKTTLKQSYSHAVLQCFANICIARSLALMVGEDHLGEPVDYSKTDSVDRSWVEHTVPDMNKSASAEFLVTLGKMRDGPGKGRHLKEPVTPYAFQMLLSKAAGAGDSKQKYPPTVEQDPALWTRDALDCLAIGRIYGSEPQEAEGKHPLIRAMFSCRSTFGFTCDECHAWWKMREEDWMIDLTDQYQPRLSDTTTTEFLESLRKNRYSDAIVCELRNCTKEGSRYSSWLYLKQAPYFLILQFTHRAGFADALETYTDREPASTVVEDYISFSFTKDMTKKQTYRLCSVVTHEWSVDRYFAYTKSRPGHWWKCDGAEISRLAESDIVKDGMDGDASLAFYKFMNESTTADESGSVGESASAG